MVSEDRKYGWCQIHAASLPVPTPGMTRWSFSHRNFRPQGRGVASVTANFQLGRVIICLSPKAFLYFCRTFKSCKKTRERFTEAFVSTAYFKKESI